MSSEAIVVFGATGFIGRNFCARQADSGRLIVAVSRSGAKVPGASVGVAMDHLAAAPDLPAGTAAVNFAAHRYEASRFAGAQSDILQGNVGIAQAVYAFCESRGISEVRAASSVAVYPAVADPLDDARPLDLNAPPHAGESFYAWSKRWGEVIAGLYRDKYGISTLSFRLSNPYGPHDSTDMDSAHVLPAFVMRALSPGDRFEIRGNADGERDFIYVDDVCRAFEDSLAISGRTEAVNLCTGRTTSLRHLAALIMRLAGEERPIVAGASIMATVATRRSPNAQVQALLGRRDFVGLEDGLHPTIDWYRHAFAQR